MALTRLFIDENLGDGAEVSLNESQARYVGRVLRLRVGDPLTVFNGRGGEFAATLQSLSRNSATILVGQQRDVATESRLKVHLVQGISRGDRMDFVVQKATELGVKRLTPVMTEYGVVKLDSRRAQKRREHWQSIANSACEQSGRTRPPLVDLPSDLNSWFGARSKHSDIDLVLQPGASTPLSSVSAPLTKVCLLVGPEGGFSDKEFGDAGAAGFSGVSLGPRILRTETAAVAAIAVAQSLWGDLRDSEV